VFDPGAVDVLVRRGLGADGSPPDGVAARLLWAVLVFELWARAFLDGDGAAPAEPRVPLVARETGPVPTPGVVS